MDILCDLGTSNFRAAMVGTDKIIAEPCCVALDTSNTATVGWKAFEMIGRAPNVIEIVKPVEGGVIRNIEAASEVIQYCAKTLTGRSKPTFTLHVSVPSQFTSVESKALEDACRSAGAKRVHYANAAVAAALGAGLPVDGPIGRLVVNLGGGKTEVSLISMNGVVASESVKTGAQTIDERMIASVRKHHFFEMGQQTAQLLKHRLTDGTGPDELEVRGRDLKTGLPGSLALSRHVVDKMVSDYCDTIVDLIRQVISECPPELAGDIIDGGILLFGGGAYIHNLVSQLQSRIEPRMMVPEQPELAVIRGLCKSRVTHRRKFPFKTAFSSITKMRLEP